MGGWSGAARAGQWAARDGIEQDGAGQGRPERGREGRRRRDKSRGWTTADVVMLAVAFVARWELGLAFLALKFWHQASGYEGSTLSFARLKWNGLVMLARAAFEGRALPISLSFGTKSSGNLAFDAWRRGELERIAVERQKLQAAEGEFTRYRDDLLQARDREAFERFMQTRDR